MLKKKS